jgi:para-nitrobenzyl esterase
MSSKPSESRNGEYSFHSDRRTFLKQSSLLIAAANAGAFLPALGTFAEAQNNHSLFVTADTAYGKVQGLDISGIKTFLGIPYGASTTGKNRFMPPQKPAPWKGVRDALTYGQICPQPPADPRVEYVRAIDWDKQNGGMGEDCLSLNVWTPGLSGGPKRTVMVSFHGGGFGTGSGNTPGYCGDPLARFGDVVVVTVNHRLASFGFLHLADLGAPPEFAQSGNAGMLDLVASLQWIRDNIANFGGDPNSVFIFGQSGGGAKTSTVMAMPAAKGLFHRAGVQSGSLLKALTRETATASAQKLLAKLEIDKSRIPDLQKLPWEQILEAQTAAFAGPIPSGLSPVLDGTVLPQNPFDPSAPIVSADVPMIVSTTLDDGALFLTNFDLSEAGLQALVGKIAGAQADRVLSAYRKTYPNVSPYAIQAMIVTDRTFRVNAYKQAERKAALGKAPAYMYLWDWPSPAFEGKFGAIHGTDVGLSFHNSRGAITGDGPEARKMADKLASAWVAFAKTGDPNNPSLPHWSPYDTKTRATMVFDKETRAENDPRGEFRVLWEELGSPGGPMG